MHKRDLLEDRRTADVTSGTSQSQAFQNYQQPMTCFVCIDHDHVKWRAKVFVALHSLYCQTFLPFLLYKTGR